MLKLFNSRSDKIKDKHRKELLPPFKGLSENEVSTLYSLGTIKTLQPGDILIKEGDIDQTAYIILSGEIKILKKINEQPKEVCILRKGEWVGEIALIRKILRTATAIAIEPSRVLALDGKILNTLEIRTQLHFYKQLSNLSVERIARLEQREAEFSQKNIALLNNIYDERTRRMNEFKNSEVIQNIIKKIPRLPPFAITLASDLMSDSIQPVEVAEKIKRDPSLVGVVMKTINSSYYGFEKKISDIHHAIMLLGFNELYQLIIAEGVRQTMPDIKIFKKIQNHCMMISQIAFILSRKKDIGKPAQMATIGLMHHLGQVVIVLLKQQNPKLEKMIDFLDQSQIGGVLLKSWSLPDIVWKSIEFQSYPEFSPPDSIPADIRHIVATIYIAHLCYENYQGKDEKKLPTMFLSEYKSLLNLEEYSLSDISHDIVLPGLMKKIDALPASLRELINEQAKIAQFINPEELSKLSKA